jgi:uncharacterized membrane protein
LTTTVIIILAAGFATYLTRCGGHLVLSRFRQIPPRVQAALDAVPAAVLTTLIAPYLLKAGPAEAGALVAGVLISLRGGLMTTFLGATAILITLRNTL